MPGVRVRVLGTQQVVTGAGTVHRPGDEFDTDAGPAGGPAEQYLANMVRAGMLEVVAAIPADSGSRSGTGTVTPKRRHPRARKG